MHGTNKFEEKNGPKMANIVKYCLNKLIVILMSENIQNISLPNILDKSALCRSGFSSAKRLRSILAQTMKAFMGLLMRSSFFLLDSEVGLEG